MFTRILVATHGTEGAKKAEAYACGLARALGAELHGLYVIHEGWGSLVGIEWLHPSHTRMEFYRYAESEFARRARQVLESFTAAAGDARVSTSVRVGDPTATILDEARFLGADLIIVGGPSRARSEEYRARISMKKLIASAPCPVLVAGNAPAALREGTGSGLVEARVESTL